METLLPLLNIIPFQYQILTSTMLEPAAAPRRESLTNISRVQTVLSLASPAQPQQGRNTHLDLLQREIDRLRDKLDEVSWSLWERIIELVHELREIQCDQEGTNS